MNVSHQYLKFVRWDEKDRRYVGYCPDLFPWGAVCHAKTEPAAYRQLCALVREEVADLLRERKPLPEPSTRPMREAILA
jgi:predicted RNase H-like HicB family nuclease